MEAKKIVDKFCFPSHAVAELGLELGLCLDLQ
jgi:hypothetical protein